MIPFILFYATILAHALQPPTYEQIQEYKIDGTWEQRVQNALSIGNHKTDSDLALKTLYKIKYLFHKSKGLSDHEIDQILAPPPIRQGMPTTGNVRMFVLCIRFNDFPPISPADDIANLHQTVFGPENTGSTNFPYETLSAFYDRSSYGLLNLSGLTMGWYNPGTNRSEVSETTTGRETLIKNAINHFDSTGVDFSQFDNDGDGDIDYFAVLWTGPHGPWASFWWGYQTSFNDSSFTVDGKSLSKYSWQWESYSYPSGLFTPKVLIHETGHALGLPDYYDYDVDTGPDGGIGHLDMMDGNWGDHNCFSKFTLDWLTPTVISNPGSNLNQTLRSSSEFSDALLIMPNASGVTFEEYFMAQHRDRGGNDSEIPTDGILVWHVNAELNGSGSNYEFDNSYTQFKLLRLMEADGLEEIETSSANADAGDFYTTGDSFTESTTPNSNAYSGDTTGIRLTGFSTSTSSTTFNTEIEGTVSPDLVVINPSVNDSSLTPGQLFTIYTTVRNQGDGTSASTTLRWYRSTNATISTSDTQIGTDPVSLLAANGTSPENITVNAPTTDGTYYVGACIDMVPGESNTGNQCSSGVQITVATATAPDLVVINPSVNDSSLTPGQSFTINATVRNQGDGPSGVSTLRWYRSTDNIISTSDTLLGANPVSSLAANGTSFENITVNAPTTDGTYFVGACVDEVGGESDTGNQCSTGVAINEKFPWELFMPAIFSGRNFSSINNVSTFTLHPSNPLIDDSRIYGITEVKKYG